MTNNVFELIENEKNQVILKVNADNTLVIARNPYISGDMDYITVTKGENHILTIIYKNGNTWSFHWGISGYTLISESTEVLRKKVVEFIEENCCIPLDLVGTIKSAKIFYNRNYGKWQLTMNEVAYLWSDTAKNLEEMVEWVKPYVTVKRWEKKIAQTGIDVWHGVF